MYEWPSVKTITKISTKLFIPTKQISFKLSLRPISNSLSIYLSLDPRFNLFLVLFLNKSKESKNQVKKVQVKNIFKTILFCDQKTRKYRQLLPYSFRIAIKDSSSFLKTPLGWVYFSIKVIEFSQKPVYPTIVIKNVQINVVQIIGRSIVKKTEIRDFSLLQAKLSLRSLQYAQAEVNYSFPQEKV